MRPKAPVQITIPEPCNMRQSDMQEVEGGAYCNACRKVVTDFSLMSDKELLNFIEKAAGKDMCGSFHPSQLNRPLVVAKKIWWQSVLVKRIAAAVFVFQSFAQHILAQTRKKPATTVQVSPAKKPVTNRTVKGQLVNYNTSTSVPPTRFLIQSGDFKLEITSDQKGNFSFELPEALPPDALVSVRGMEQNKKMVIKEEMLPVSTLLANGVHIYRCPFEWLPPVIVSGTRPNVPPLVDGGYKIGRAPVVKREKDKRPGIWKRFTQLFHPPKANE